MIHSSQTARSPTESLFRLDGKVALITGSSRGIGLATARQMAQMGARVVISSRKPQACQAVQAQFAEQGLQAIAIPCHVANEQDLQALVDETVRAYGRIDVLVANAAVNPVFAAMQDLSLEVWAKVLNTNLTSTWRLSQLALPIIAEQGGGSMVILSSIASLIAAPMEGAYAVSKAGLNHLARQLAVEWGPKNIRVNVVVPGLTETDMIRTTMAAEGAREAAAQAMPLRRIGAPEDVAAAVLFLASEASRQMTGQHLVVDGGQTLTARHP